MYSNLRSFILFVSIVVIFSSVALGSIYDELKFFQNNKSKISNRFVEKAYNVDPNADLMTITGEEVLGMVPLAINGEYDLLLDGILITQSQDVEYVNFSGVVNQKYKIQMVRHPATNKVTVIANVVP